MERHGNEIVYDDTEIAKYRVTSRMSANQALDRANQLREVAKGLTESALAYQIDAGDMPDGPMSFRHQQGVRRAAELMSFVMEIESLCVPEMAEQLFGELGID